MRHYLVPEKWLDSIEAKDIQKADVVETDGIDKEDLGRRFEEFDGLASGPSGSAGQASAGCPGIDIKKEPKTDQEKTDAEIDAFLVTGGCKAAHATILSQLVELRMFHPECQKNRYTHGGLVGRHSQVHRQLPEALPLSRQLFVIDTSVGYKRRSLSIVSATNHADAEDYADEQTEGCDHADQCNR